MFFKSSTSDVFWMPKSGPFRRLNDFQPIIGDWFTVTVISLDFQLGNFKITMGPSVTKILVKRL